MSRPLYARMLRLRYLAPSGFLCFVFLEGAVALGILLALAELVSWWGVLVLPAAVAAMVKLNDAVTGALIRPVPAGAGAAAGRAVPAQRPPVVAHAAGRWSGVWQASVVSAPVRVPSPPGSERALGSPVPEGALSSSAWEGAPGSAASEGALGSSASEGAVDRRGAADYRRAGAWPGAGMPAVAEVEVSAINGSPSARQWMDQIDTGQRLRQSANRRYE
jgi:hypothetical protein